MPDTTAANSTPLEIARTYLARGWNPIPIYHRKKNPIGDEWQKLIITESNVATHFNGAKLNIGIQLGPKSHGLTDVDLDCDEAVRLARHFLPRTPAYFGRDSKPNSHFLYTIDDTPAKAAIKHSDKIGKGAKCIVELRMGGGPKGAQTVFPGSMHESGEPIVWAHEGTPAQSDYATLKSAVDKIAVGTILQRAWPGGSGHNASLALGGFLARCGWSENDIEKFVGIIAPDEKWKDDSARTAKDSAKAFARGEKVQGLPGLREQFGEEPAKLIAKYLDYRSDDSLDSEQLYEILHGKIEPATGEQESMESAPAFSEEMLALTYTRLHGETQRYVAVWGKWLIYDGAKWDFDETLQTYSLARKLCRTAAEATNNKRLARMIANAKTRNAVVTLACSDPRHAATVAQWDVDPWLLNTPGGVVDLRTGRLREHRADDYMTKMTAVTPDAKCPTPLLQAFLTTVTAGDVGLQEFLKRMSGYALTGVTIEHALFFLYGTGANGESVWTNTVAGILHDYHKTAPLETFTVSANERHPTELAMLRGARLVTVSETEAGKRWSESRIKTLTGGDPIDARFMRQDYFEYLPQFKLMISGNHRPGLNSVNEAIKRRVNMVPFKVTIAEKQRDKDLTEKLKAEWPGILAWMIEGCLEWQRIGLRPPKIVTDATEEYLKSEDKLGRCIEECLEIDPNEWMSSTDLFYSWKQWAEDNNEWVGSQTKLSIDLKDAGFEPVKKETGNGFAKLTLKPGFAGVAGGCKAPGAAGGACQRHGVCEAHGKCLYGKGPSP